jgi:hypothetical protein
MEAGSEQCKEPDDENFCELSVPASHGRWIEICRFKFDDTVGRFCRLCEENGMDRGRRNVIGECKGGDEVSK